MPITVLDLDDAKLAGAMSFKAFQREWLAQWLKPLLEIVTAKRNERIVIEWDKMPPELHDAMKSQLPEQYAQAERAVAQMKEQYK
jgi:hypothetical protein